MDLQVAGSFLTGLAVGLIGAFATSLASLRAARAARAAAEISAAAAREAAQLAAETAKEVAQRTLEGQRLLARDAALREWRSGQLEPLLEFANKRVTDYQDLYEAIRRGERGDSQRLQSRIRVIEAQVASFQSLISRLNWLAYPSDSSPLSVAIHQLIGAERKCWLALQAIDAGKDGRQQQEAAYDSALLQLYAAVASLNRVAEE